MLETSSATTDDRQALLLQQALDRPSVAQADDGDASLTTAEAAAYLGCTKGWLEKERLTGGGPDWFRLGIRLGVRYRRSALNQYIKGRTRIAERPRVAA